MDTTDTAPNSTPPLINHIGQLVSDPRNARRHNPRNVGMLQDGIQEVGFARSIVIDETNTVLAGNATLDACGLAGLENVRVIEADGNTIIAVRRTGLTPEQKTRLALLDNRVAELASWDSEVLQALVDDGANLAGLWNDEEFAAVLAPVFDEPITGAVPGDHSIKGSLADRFLVPPFSILDARQGYWQDRKRQWLATGLQSEVGRGDNLLDRGEGTRDMHHYDKLRGGRGKRPHVIPGGGAGTSSVWKHKGDDGKLLSNAQRARSFKTEGNASEQSGTSIFDPVLCEVVYRWFAPPGALVLDPFAGGSVRGIVAAKLGHQYTGLDLRAEQIEANEAQAGTICGEVRPVWICGDSANVRALASGEYDLLFSCPPYADLEVYSDNPADLSQMPYSAFVAAYRAIIRDSLSMLKPDRFACFVVGDVRDKRGNYRNFVSDTIAAFRDAGAELYNEAILITQIGSLPVRIGKQFTGSRKLGKTHQNVLVFLKGDAKKATAACGPVEIDDAAFDGVGVSGE